jgi:hypothetical protein
LAAAVLAAVAFSAAPASSATSDQQWQTAKLVSYTQKQGSDSGTAQTTGQANSDGSYSANTTEQDWSYVDYQVVIDDGKMLYFGTMRETFRWQHTPVFTENETVRYALKGEKLVVVDDAGKEIKLKIFKRRIKE